MSEMSKRLEQACFPKSFLYSYLFSWRNSLPHSREVLRICFFVCYACHPCGYTKVINCYNWIYHSENIKIFMQKIVLK